MKGIKPILPGRTPYLHEPRSQYRPPIESLANVVQFQESNLEDIYARDARKDHFISHFRAVNSRWLRKNATYRRNVDKGGKRD